MMREQPFDKKQLVIDLCRSLKALDLAAGLAVGDITIAECFHELYRRTHDDQFLDLARREEKYQMTQAQNKVADIDLRETGTKRPARPLAYATLTEMMEAQLHGISNETYVHNKLLPLAERLKLPDYEAIYALNYKEHKHERK